MFEETAGTGRFCGSKASAIHCSLSIHSFHRFSFGFNVATLEPLG
jgi:hypothetical protein